MDLSLSDDHEIRKPENLVRVKAADDAVIIEVGGEEYERIDDRHGIDPRNVDRVADVIRTILGDEAYLVPEESAPHE
jgi:hypothetical protein